MKEHVHNFRLPIFDPCNLWIIVTDNVAWSRDKRAKILGKHDGINYAGLHSYDEKGKFFIFLRRDAVAHDLIAHEVFHATCRMLEYCCHTLSAEKHEPHAYLCGYLTKMVYADLCRWGVRVRQAHP